MLISFLETLSILGIIIWLQPVEQVEDEARQHLRHFRKKAGIDDQEHLLVLNKQVLAFSLLNLFVVMADPLF